MPPEPLATPARTLTETIEELLVTTVAETTMAVTSTETVRATVGNVSVSVLGVRCVPLNAELTSSSDEHVVAVHAVLQNTSNEAVLFQSATDTALRDASGNAYPACLVARVGSGTRA